jgi:CRP/FNR family transcriptional regulator, cyclic AMP receptor protein
MSSLIELTANRPTRTLAADEVLLAQGDGGGDLFILLSGELSVLRDGVKLATLSQPGTLVGEMSVLLGTRSSATVQAERETKVRVVRDARQILESEPGLAMRIAALVAGRLDATSALLVELSKQHKEGERNVFTRILNALHAPAADRAKA